MIDLDKIMEQIVEEGYRRYLERPEIDRDLVRSIYSVWMDLALKLGEILKDARPKENKNAS
jgi:hypothetical protein